MTQARCRLVACGVFRKEVRWLIEKNGWPVEAVFFDPALHVRLDRLEAGLTAALSGCRDEGAALFCGACHPRLDRILALSGSTRTPVENCVEALLGRPVYLRELERGAFFLFEEWARQARRMMLEPFGGDEAVAREIYQAERTHLLCVRTPCSGDFSADASEAGRLVGLPLRWMDASLEHLEAVLLDTLERRLARGRPCPS